SGDEETADTEAMEEESGDDAMDEGMEPQRGGTLTYLLEAESDTWDIPGANCAVACITVMNSVADTLTTVTADGEVEPFLLSEFTPNDDFTEFNLVMRDGVTFHDGTPADGAALHKNLLEMANGLLQGQVFFDLVNGAPQNPANPGDAADSIVLNEDQSVTVTFDKPFATFGNNLAGRTGWLIAPSFWDSESRAGDLMVATGPFEMVNQVRGEVTEVRAYDGYWRDGADGEKLPYLDGVDFRPNPDPSARRATMEAGDADVNQDSFGENQEFWDVEWVEQGNGVVEEAAAREVGYLMLNNSKPPFDNPQFREAVALCTDRNEYLTFRAPGNMIANGPFAEGSAGYIEDPGFPEFDPDAGNAILDEIGRLPIQYGTTNSPANLLTAELFADQWSSNCGLDVSIDQFEQAELITKALTGDFEVFAWRNHGQGHPGLELVWWHSRHAEGLALNFGRLVSPEMDELLFESWTTTDQDELDTIAQEINTLFADNVFNIWLETTEWAIPYRAGVHGLQQLTLESGNPNQQSLAGRATVDEAWIES
ncbi:ABC transporter substrate-binding protein, partial [Ilumatobacter nonamiensis]|uniref:ABC transporter substrate-binding protein n=1 Tax=Ilumatobacter nonamiensis TaxID=467093 RepID=UPI00058FAA9F